MTRRNDRAHAGLQDLFSYPVAACLQDRRTRRVAQGVSIRAGEISYESANDAVAADAARGGDPDRLDRADRRGHARRAARQAERHAGARHAVPARDRPGGEQRRQLPGDVAVHDQRRGRSGCSSARASRRRSISSTRSRRAGRTAREADWLAYANAVKRKVHDGRFEFPREWPYYLGWNAQHSNAPGTTCFLPVVDHTRQYINVLLILLSEPTARCRCSSTSGGRSGRAARSSGWRGSPSKIGARRPDPLPADRRRQARPRRLRDAETPVPLGAASATVRTDPEAYFLIQNLMLMGEALRLGGWVHGAPIIPCIWQRDAEKGYLGLGFREHGWPSPRRPLARWPPGAGLAAQLRRHRRRARGPVPAVRHRHGRRGRPGARGEVRRRRRVRRPELFGQAYRDTEDAARLPRARSRTPPEAVAYTKEICRYLVETYGRFPAHTDAFHLPGIWVQFSHLEIEYYDRFGTPGHAQRAAEGRELWGR